VKTAQVMAACSDPRELSQACDGGDCTAHVHQPGIADPSSPNFHVNVDVSGLSR
jgi:hypothetical protein